MTAEESRLKRRLACMPVETLKSGILNAFIDSDWNTDELISICVLPYLDHDTLVKIAENHCISEFEEE